MIVLTDKSTASRGHSRDGSQDMLTRGESGLVIGEDGFASSGGEAVDFAVGERGRGCVLRAE